MVKKSLLFQKLASYSTLATIILAAEKNANAQILYKEVNDTICPGEIYQLDLNNDGVNDFAIQPYSRNQTFSSPSFFNYVRVINENNNAVADIKANTEHIHYQQNHVSSYIEYDKDTVADIFNSGQEIGASDNFTEINPDLIYRAIHSYIGRDTSVSYFGLWDTTEHDKFLGLQLEVNSNTYYGWARLTVVSKGSYPMYYCVELKDYAVNTQPGDSILAGEGAPTGIQTITNNNSLTLFPDPVSRKSTLNLSFHLINNQPAAIVIYDITGRQVLSIDLQNPIAGINTLKINIADLAAGIYLLKFTSPQFESTKKFVIVQ